MHYHHVLLAYLHFSFWSAIFCPSPAFLKHKQASILFILSSNPQPVDIFLTVISGSICFTLRTLSSNVSKNIYANDSQISSLKISLRLSGELEILDNFTSVSKNIWCLKKKKEYNLNCNLSVLLFYTINTHPLPILYFTVKVTLHLTFTVKINFVFLCLPQCVTCYNIYRFIGERKVYFSIQNIDGGGPVKITGKKSSS